MSTSKLELLLHEIQTLIMEYTADPRTLSCLIRASPPFYELFKSRRGYFLSELASWSFNPDIFHVAWETVQASKLSNLDCHERDEKVREFLRHRDSDTGYAELIFSADDSIPLIRFGTCINWLVEDFANNALSMLTKLGDMADIAQDQKTLRSNLSRVEKARIQRAFCHWETFVRLLPRTTFDPAEFAVRFLQDLDIDEVEEISCIRDYLMHRLWVVFDRIEDDFVSNSETRNDVEASGYNGWFESMTKWRLHIPYMQEIMQRGLLFINAILSSDLPRSAELFLSSGLSGGAWVDNLLKERGIEAIPDAEKIRALKARVAGA